MSATQLGIFIYAKDIERLAAFYSTVLGLALKHRKSDMIVLAADGMQLVIHQTPGEIASRIEIDSPPQKREQAAMKFFCSVPSLAEAGDRAAELGGEVMPQHWQGPGFVVRNACDPEGNIFQLREPSAEPGAGDGRRA